MIQDWQHTNWLANWLAWPINAIGVTLPALLAAAAAAAFRKFLPSFLETGFTFGRSLIAVFCDTSDGADKCVEVDVFAVDVVEVVVVPKLPCDWLGTGIDVNINALWSIPPTCFLLPINEYIVIKYLNR